MAAGARDWLALPGRTAAALRVQGFDKGRGPVGLPPIGQACQLPAWPDQGPREGSLVKFRGGPVSWMPMPAGHGCPGPWLSLIHI